MKSNKPHSEGYRGLKCLSINSDLFTSRRTVEVVKLELQKMQEILTGHKGARISVRSVLVRLIHGVVNWSIVHFQ
jgi:hypothetical protein